MHCKTENGVNIAFFITQRRHFFAQDLSRYQCARRGREDVWRTIKTEAIKVRQVRRAVPTLRAEARAQAQAPATVTKTSSLDRKDFLEHRGKTPAPETSVAQETQEILETSEAQEIPAALAVCQDPVDRTVEADRAARVDRAAEADLADRARLFQRERCTEHGAPFFRCSYSSGFQQGAAFRLSELDLGRLQKRRQSLEVC